MISQNRMLLDLLELLVGELSSLVDDFIGHANLANIMQEGCKVDLIAVLVRVASLFCNLPREYGNPGGMTMGVPVLGVDGVGQGFCGLNKLSSLALLCILKNLDLVNSRQAYLFTQR